MNVQSCNGLAVVRVSSIWVKLIVETLNWCCSVIWNIFQFIISLTAEVIFRLLTPPLILAGLLITSSRSMEKCFFWGERNQKSSSLNFSSMIQADIICRLYCEHPCIYFRNEMTYTMINCIESESSVLFLSYEVHQEYLIFLLIHWVKIRGLVFKLLSLCYVNLQ